MQNKIKVNCRITQQLEKHLESLSDIDQVVVEVIEEYGGVSRLPLSDLLVSLENPSQHKAQCERY